MTLPFFRGWIVVGSASLVLMAAFGLQFSYGVFLPHIARDLGISHAAVSAPIAIYLAIYALLSFVTGRLTDRFGPRLIVMGGGILLGSGFALVGAATSDWHLYAALCALAAFGMSAAFIPLNATVVKWFVRRRGLALAVSGTGLSAAALFGPSTAALLIPWLGWRGAMMALAITAGGLIVLCALALVRDPESSGLRPDGELSEVDRPAMPDADAAEPSWTLNKALSALPFWTLLCAFMFTWTPLFLPYFHLPAMAGDLGYTPAGAAGIIAAMGLGGLLGRLGIGWLSDRIGRVLAIHLALFAQIVACVAISNSSSIELLGIAAALFSAGASSVAILFVAVVGDIFGRLHAGAISGFIFAVAGCMASVGPYVAGVIRDVTGTYELAFLFAAVCNVVAIVLLALFRAPRRKERVAERAA